MMKCMCGSDALIHLGNKTYCVGCFDAGVAFGTENAEKLRHFDKDLKKIRAEIDKEYGKMDEVIR